MTDILVLESTYGNKVHSGRKDRRSTLLKVLKKSIADNGIVIIPAFAIGRTQELLYELNAIFESKNLPKYLLSWIRLWRTSLRHYMLPLSHSGIKNQEDSLKKTIIPFSSREL
ncbi:MAG: hypothetical protein MRK02_05710 [Candidatus Scalindua sp.]|nr:hypothetical protein [Candidatus Scalindua sp.]